MTTIRERLRLRYGLPMTPSSDDIANWQDRIQALHASGMDLERAAEDAASEVFAGFEANRRTEEIELFSVLTAEMRGLWLSPASTLPPRATAA